MLRVGPINLFRIIIIIIITFIMILDYYYFFFLVHLDIQYFNI